MICSFLEYTLPHEISLAWRTSTIVPKRNRDMYASRPSKDNISAYVSLKSSRCDIINNNETILKGTNDL